MICHPAGPSRRFSDGTESLGGGAFSGQRVISTAADGARSVYARDLAGDGDADVLSASHSDAKIAWYENLSPRVNGDANRDGLVDDDDLSLLPANWNRETDWIHGEFSGRPPVNDDDLSLLLANWTGAGGGVLSAGSEGLQPAVQVTEERSADVGFVVSAMDGSTDPRNVAAASNLGLPDFPAESLRPLVRYFDVHAVTGRGIHSPERSDLDEEPVALLAGPMAPGT